LEAGAKRVTDALNNLMMAASTAEAKSLADIDLTTPLKQVLLETVTMKYVLNVALFIINRKMKIDFSLTL
jgi:hypothetical protein